LYGLEIYQRIQENSRFFLEKKIEILQRLPNAITVYLSIAAVVASLQLLEYFLPG